MGAIASQITSLTIVYSIAYSGADQRKLQSSASLAFVWGIHRDRWIPRTKGQVRGKCFHLVTSSCSSHNKWRRQTEPPNYAPSNILIPVAVSSARWPRRHWFSFKENQHSTHYTDSGMSTVILTFPHWLHWTSVLNNLPTWEHFSFTVKWNKIFPFT